MFCIHCGSEIKEGSGFCIFCGEPIPSGASASAFEAPISSVRDPVLGDESDKVSDALPGMRPGSSVQTETIVPTIPIASVGSAIPIGSESPVATISSIPLSASATIPNTSPTTSATVSAVVNPPVTPVKKKKRTGLIIGLVLGGIVLSVLIVAGIIVSQFLISKTNKRNTPGPDVTVETEETDLSEESTKETTEQTEAGVLKLDGMEIDFGDADIEGEAKDYITLVDLKDEEAPDGLASDLYDLTLDPDSGDKVTVRIPYTENPSEKDTDAVPMLGIGRTITFDDGSTETVYTYLSAEIKDKIATASFVPADRMGELLANGSSSGKGSSAPSREKVRAGIFWCTTQYTDGGHFLVYFPAQPMKFFIDNKDRDALLKDLEAVYNKYLGLNFTYAKRTQWPMEVTVRNLSSNEGAYVYGYDGAGGSIEINRDFFEGGYQPTYVKPILAHEFFHFVQMNYVEYDNDCPWFDEATATYFEGEESGSVPGVVSKYQSQIFEGAIPPENTPEAGYARMPLIRYLVEKYSADFIRSVYVSAGSGTSWDSAITDIIDQPSSWAGEFYTKLTNGSYWDDRTYSLYKGVADDSFPGLGQTLPLEIPSEEDIATAAENGDPPLLGQVSLEVGSYGAQLAAITISKDMLKQIPDGIDPEVRAATGAEMRVFSIRSKTVTELAVVDGAASLTDFKKASADKTVFLVLIIGTHTDGKQSYDVQVTLPLFPTLDELIGSYMDGKMIINNVFISEELRKQLADEAANPEDEEPSPEDQGAEGLGCDIDIDILAMLEQMKGLENPAVLTIEKTGEDTGNLKLSNADAEDEEAVIDEDAEAIPFTYDQGNIILEYTIDGDTVNGLLLARYLPGKKGVGVDGTMRLTLADYPESDFYIDITISGTLPFETP